MTENEIRKSLENNYCCKGTAKELNEKWKCRIVLLEKNGTTEQCDANDVDINKYADNQAMIDRDFKYEVDEDGRSYSIPLDTLIIKL